nr:CC-NBS-LRR resistance protein [Tanacetum cinerariifolium]
MSRVKHLSLYQVKDSNLLKDMASRTLHTLLLRGVVTKISFQDFKCLRILKLRDTALSEGIHDSVGDLVHLSKEEAIKADLVGKKNPYKIEFHWNTSKENARRNDKDILEGLKTPANVKSLTIVNYSSDCFPTWIMNMSTNIGGKWISLDKLVVITSSGCRNVLRLPT